MRVAKDNRNLELRAINELFQDINDNKGSCTSLGRVDFNEQKSIGDHCGGTFTKVQKGAARSIVFENTRCTNVVVGLETRTNWFSGTKIVIQNNNTATRLYELKNPSTHKISIQINQDALGSDKDTYVLLASDSGKSCVYMDVRF